MTRARDIADVQDNLGGAVAPFVGGKNKIINGDFFWNQRNYSSSVISTSATVFGTDRWRIANDPGSGTVTYSVQPFTTGTAPVAGYESKQFSRIVTTGQTLAGTYTILAQGIENARILAGQVATISFWAKSATGTPKISVEIQQVGTPSSPRTYLGQVTINTSWARYSVTATIPALSGTITGDDRIDLNLWVSGGSTYNSLNGSLGIQSNTFDFWGIQFEAGSVATPFTTASGSIGGELALCQRYYYRSQANSSFSFLTPFCGIGQSGTAIQFGINTPVTMRIIPSSVEFSGIRVADGTGIIGVSSIALDSGNNISIPAIVVTVASGAVQYRMYNISANSNSSAYLALSAEL